MTVMSGVHQGFQACAGMTSMEMPLAAWNIHPCPIWCLFRTHPEFPWEMLQARQKTRKDFHPPVGGGDGEWGLSCVQLELWESSCLIQKIQSRLSRFPQCSTIPRQWKLIFLLQITPKPLISAGSWGRYSRVSTAISTPVQNSWPSTSWRKHSAKTDLTEQFPPFFLVKLLSNYNPCWMGFISGYSELGGAPGEEWGLSFLLPGIFWFLN